MADEPEVIKHQIDETASSLKEKVELLEEQVLGTVKGTTEAVTDTVENVKETVAETIETVKETVQETVQTVKRTFDLRYQTQQHPWLMMGGSVVAGFTAGKLLGRWTGYEAEATNGRYHAASASAPVSGGYPETPSSYMRAPSQEAAPGSQPGIFSKLTNMLGPEIAKVKQTAIGTIFGLLRDMAKQHLPATLASKVDEVMDSVTTKLGGEPIAGPVSESSAGDRHSRFE
jgi:ElaB/YqjD/DUF883 family membrane-anchored ribosome-binding protein